MDTRNDTVENRLEVPSKFAHIKGWGSDLMRGHVPNVFAEMGGKAEFKYNREAAVQKTVVLSTIALLGLLLWNQSKNRQRHLARQQMPGRRARCHD